MDFVDTPEEAAWRNECGAWLAEKLPRLDDAPDDLVGRSKAWQAMKFDAGLAKITWGPEHGGRNGTPAQAIIFNQELKRHRAPFDWFQVGTEYIAPALRAHGTDEQRGAHLRSILRGETVWCQMFSEPNAGSDVAGLGTTAVRDGDEWVINGQKVWTSFAHFADFGEILCRTDPDAPKHRGITAFILDLRTPGVTIRPLKQMSGASDFNEIFLDDVRVPHDNVIGDVHDGWHVAVTTMMNERTSIGSSSGSRPSTLPLRLADLARCHESLDAVTRQRIADIHIRMEASRFLGLRTLTAVLQGRTPGPESSVAKLAKSSLEVDIGALAMSILGTSATVELHEQQRWVDRFLTSPGHRLGGGTDEVNRNIVAERVLGLPGEPRTDDTERWRDVPR